MPLRLTIVNETNDILPGNFVVDWQLFNVQFDAKRIWLKRKQYVYLLITLNQMKNGISSNVAPWLRQTQ